MKNIKWIFVLLGIAGLVSVRVMEENLFYDPFLYYFKDSSSQSAFPQFDWFPLILSHFFRFFLNLFFSLIIIHFSFLNKVWTFQGGVLMVIFFAVSFPIYLFCLSTEFNLGELFSFYIRRFVIQPLSFLIIYALFFFRTFL